MATLTPSEAAKLAAQIYLTQDDESVSKFYTLNKSLLSDQQAPVLKGVHGSRVINTLDTFGVCCAGSGAFENDAFIILRGSTGANKGADWISNGRIGLEIGESGLPVHIGFNHIFGSMKEQIKTQLKKLPRKPVVLHCVGHSLGGALATLTADWAKKNGYTVKLYTFGAPRPATHLFSKSFTNRVLSENIFRVYHESDPVPMVPIFPFCHAPFGELGYMIQTSKIFWPPDHRSGKYRETVRRQSWKSLTAVRDYEPSEAELKRWLEQDLHLNPEQPSVWKWLNSAISFVVRKILGVWLSGYQAIAVGLVTVADTIAAVLVKAFDNNSGPSNGGPTNGASPVGSPGYFVLCLMRKILRIVGQDSKVNESQLTRNFMRMALQRLIEKSHLSATRAVQGLTA